MIQLVSKKLNEEIQRELDILQEAVNNEQTFEKKVAKAKKLWNSKGGAKGEKAFENVREVLYGLCVYEGLCNYCEQNEANDIEHIYPKSFFPTKAFLWENYLLACKQCNSGYKLDECYVLDNNDDIFEVKRGEEPKYSVVAFINPRVENPSDFMILNLKTFKFEIIPDLNQKDSNKVKATLEILELNQRDTLIVARKSAGKHYYEMMDRLVRILKAANQEELQQVLTPYDEYFNFSQPLDDIKSEIKASYKKYIGSYQHPSVWQSIKKIDSKISPKWKTIFEKIPEALDW
jgi:uncharacterized protein (TIGR02646 family)